MKFDANRLSVLSGLEDVSKGKIMNESRKNKSLNENKLRKIIREEIQAYLNAKISGEEKQIDDGLRHLNLGRAMGYLNVTPPYAQQHVNKSFSRGPGRSFGFGGPGFM